jgi:hypothetical protein
MNIIDASRVVNDAPRVVPQFGSSLQERKPL